MSLLDKAVASACRVQRARGHIDDGELLELAIAYVEGQVSQRQAGSALSVSRAGALQNFARCLRRAIADGRITITRTPQPAVRT